MVRQITVDKYHAKIGQALKLCKNGSDFKDFFKSKGFYWGFYNKLMELAHEKNLSKTTRQDVFRILTELTSEYKAIDEKKRNQKITEFIKKEDSSFTPAKDGKYTYQMKRFDNKNRDFCTKNYDFSNTDFGTFKKSNLVAQSVTHKYPDFEFDKEPKQTITKSYFWGLFKITKTI